MAIEITVKRRPKIDAKKIISELDYEQESHEAHAISLYETSVLDWVKGPEFSATFHRVGNKDFVNIYARGTTRALYARLDAGFMRPVEVTDDWISKTVPGILRSRPGRGHLKRGPDGKPLLLESPEPVIPRNFTKLVADLIRQEYFTGMRAVWNKHFKATNG